MSERRQCCINDCPNKRRTVDESFHYYGVPKSLEIREQWAAWIAQQNGGDINDLLQILSKGKHFVCSDHFTPEDKGPKKLKPRAVPTLPTERTAVLDPSPTAQPLLKHTYDEYSTVVEIDMTQTAPEPAESNFQTGEASSNLETTSAARKTFANHSNGGCSTSREYDIPKILIPAKPLTRRNFQCAETRHNPKSSGVVRILVESFSKAGCSASSEDATCTTQSFAEVVGKVPAGNVAEHESYMLPSTGSTKINLNQFSITHAFVQENDKQGIDESAHQSSEILEDSVYLFDENILSNLCIGVGKKTQDGDSPALEAHSKIETYVILHDTENSESNVKSNQSDFMNWDSQDHKGDILGTSEPEEIMANKFMDSVLNFSEDGTAANKSNDAGKSPQMSLSPAHQSQIAASDTTRTDDQTNNNLIEDFIHINSEMQNNTSRHKKCSALGCINPVGRFFSFPACVIGNHVHETNAARCKEWIRLSGNDDLLKQHPSLLHGKKFLCSAHFKTDQFFNIHRVTLLTNAMPSEFSCPPISDDVLNTQFNISAEIFSVPNENDQRENESAPNQPDLGESNTEPTADKPPPPFKLSDEQKKFIDYMNSLEWRKCSRCKEKFFVPKKSTVKCLHSKNTCVNYTSLNDMDPGEVPPELQDLTYLEEQLISKILPTIQVTRLNHHQFGYKGNVINFPQNVKEFAKKLPHRIQDLTSTITIKTTQGIKPIEFRVRAKKVKDALEWLRENNPFYADIELSEENLADLPEDGNVYDRVTSIELPQNDCKNSDRTEHHNVYDETGEESLDGESTDDNDCDEEFTVNVQESGIPMAGMPSENAQIQSALDWPTKGNQPISEFTTVGYVAQAFPCLFPFGKADLRAPREFKMSPLNYFKHLMRYHDNRFAKHTRFRYFALNSLMRWSALSDGNVYVDLNSEYKDMTVNQLKDEMVNNPNIVKKIMYQSSNIRGTKSYWYARSKELLAMIEQLGMPTLFFTLSAADFHWPDLYKLLEPDKDPDTISSKERRKLIEENPMIVNNFFFERADKFLKLVLKEKFNLKDYWFRVEYQHRGSPHVHGVLWLENAPDVSNLKNLPDEDKQKVVDYFDQLVSTIHPNCSEPIGPVHPCTTKLIDIQDGVQDLAQLLNRVQRHTRCTDGYCYRVNKKTGKKECRFKFPKNLQEKSEITVCPETGKVEMVTARNDPRLNKYNAFIIQTWRANIDVSPVISKRALITYLAKYISKPEKESKTMAELLRNLIASADENKSVKSILQRLYIQSCSERDYSAQETCHLLMGLKLVSTDGRNFVTVNFSSYKKWVQVPQNEKRKTKTIFQRYMERRYEQFKDKCLWFMVKNYNMTTNAKYKKEAIVQVFPKLKMKVITDDNHEVNEDFYHQQCMLYVPWKSENELLGNQASWKEVYENNIAVINQNRSADFDFGGVEPEEDEYQEEFYDDIYSPEDWMVISGMGHSKTAEEVELGRREIDVNYDWNHALSSYDTNGGLNGLANFLSEQKQSKNISEDEPILYPDVVFTSEQESILKLVDLQIESIKNNMHATDFQLPKTVIVQGRAGTGKSLVIQAMKHKIKEAFGSKGNVIMTPTGVSAKAIGGSTIHSKLHINTRQKEFLPLKGSAAHKLEQDLESAKFLIIDEFSMIGCQMMHMIEERLRQAKGNDSGMFGNLFVFIFGDIKQLPPIGDTPVYSDKQTKPETIRGKMVYDSFQGAVVLDKIMRQNDKTFQDVLNNISEGNVSQKDYQILKSRFTTSVSNSEKRSFHDAVHLYPTRLQVMQHNKERLLALKDSNNKPAPIARIPALHNCPKATTGTTDEAEGLQPVIYLAEGAKIMLKSNLWTEQGLVNGAVGKVEHILYPENANPLVDPPSVIMCRFDNYSGPALNDNLVPITPLTKSWTANNNEQCSRTQFPIALSFACSIHQSQGMTLEKVYINIGDKEMAAGITYVALSRAKTLNGILLEGFAYSRLAKLNTKESVKDRKRWEQNLRSKNLTYAF